jgi:hypothetical protein
MQNPENFDSQLRTVDHSARRSMKNAANCAKHGELQGFMKPLHVERILRPWLTGRGHARLRVDETHLLEPEPNHPMLSIMVGVVWGLVCLLASCHGGLQAESVATAV